MIVIQVQLANVSLISLFICLLSVATTTVGLVLGIHEFSADRRLQIPACLTASAALCVAISQFFGVLMPYKLVQMVSNVVTSTLLAGSGLYYICERLAPRSTLKAQQHSPSLERAFMCLWLCSLLTALAVTGFSIGASWLATEQNAQDSSASVEEVEAYDQEEATESKNLFHLKKPRFKRSMHSLGSPVDIPTVSTHPESHSPLSPQLSWPSTVGSLRRNASLGSLRSALDINTRSSGDADTHHTHKDSMGTHEDKLPNKTPSPGKTPKSPLKIHLSRSSFSLRRSPTKSSQNPPNARRSIAEMRPSSHTAHSPTEQHTLGIPLGIAQEHSGQHGWVMIPNENTAESRSASGSSQLTGNVFPASEYNRKINAAGFQRDEPVPVKVRMAPSLESLSQYDLERTHKMHRQHQR